MDEKDIQQSLEAIHKSGKEVTSSPEAARRFLQEIGVMGGDGNLKPMFKDNVPSVHNTPQPNSGV